MPSVRLAALAVVALAGLAAEPAAATFPGRNGEIALTHEVGSRYANQQSGLLVYAPPYRTDVDRPVCGVQTYFSSAYCWALGRASFSPDGASLAVIADEGTGSWPGTPVLWLLTPDGRRTERLPLAEHRWEVRWSPDGSAFVTTGFLDPNDERPSTERRSAVFVLNRDGSERELLAADASEPDWCADGRVVFAQYGEIRILDSDRSVRRLTWHGGTDPSCAPDGSQVAFVRRGTIWTVPTSGGRARRITPRAAPVRDAGGMLVGFTAPVWSPDGKQIAYLRTKPERGAGLATYVNRIGLRRGRIRGSDLPVMVRGTYYDSSAMDPDWRALTGP